jgi:hypothetical protein
VPIARRRASFFGEQAFQLGDESFAVGDQGEMTRVVDPNEALLRASSASKKVRPGPPDRVFTRALLIACDGGYAATTVSIQNPG